jgi:hypothetical protein
VAVDGSQGAVSLANSGLQDLIINTTAEINVTTRDARPGSFSSSLADVTDTPSVASIALATCAAIPDLEPDDQLVRPPLRDLGIDTTVAVWDDPDVDWGSYDLVVLRSTWDYSARRDSFTAWAASVPRLVNDAAIVAWNTDKRYLAELSGAGARVIPTEFVTSRGWTPPTDGTWVIKPTISAGSRDTGRYDMSSGADREHAAAHLGRLVDAGRVAMVQPYLGAVDSYGETALVFFDGVFSHAIRKGPMLSGPDRGSERLYMPEAITPRIPSAAELAAAKEVLEAIPARLPAPLYARVDLIPGPDGAPTLVELELTEPSLFLQCDEEAAQRFAAALRARLG